VPAGKLWEVSLAFRPLSRADFPVLDTWLAAEHVARWWPELASGGSAASAFGPCVDGDDPTEAFVVVDAGRAVGLVQRYLLTDYPAWRDGVGMEAAAGIDYLIGEEELTGVGLGPRIITAFTALTLERYTDVESVVVAVQQANRASWRALEKAGYHRVFAGTIDSDDPSDEGPSYLYLRER